MGCALFYSMCTYLLLPIYCNIYISYLVCTCEQDCKIKCSQDIVRVVHSSELTNCLP